MNRETNGVKAQLLYRRNIEQRIIYERRDFTIQPSTSTRDNRVTTTTPTQQTKKLYAEVE